LYARSPLGDVREIFAISYDLPLGEPVGSAYAGEWGRRQSLLSPDSSADFLDRPAAPDVDGSDGKVFASDLSSYGPRFVLMQLHAPQPGKRRTMRSQLVFTANCQVANRFLLATLAMRVACRLHISSSPTEHTVNHALAEIAKGRFIDAKMPELAQLPAIDALLIVPAA
jgi:hypothetical protein